jgi:hypothetical protein
MRIARLNGRWGGEAMAGSLYRGQALAAHPAAVCQNGLAAFGGIAVQKTVLPSPADL